MEDVKVVEDISNKMVAITRVILKTTWLTVMENILTDQVTDIRDNGKIICQMVKEKLSILTRADIMENF